MGGLFSSSKTTKSSNYGQQFGTNTNVSSFSNPALEGFQNNLMGNIQRGMDQSNQPLYGQAQIGSYAGNLNDLANSSIKALRANLARTGGLGGGGAAAGETAIGMGKFGNMSNFMANLPQMNRTAALQAAQTYGGLGNQLMSVAPRSQYGQQYGTNTGTGVSKQTENPSIMGDIGSMIGVAGGFMGMPFMQSFMQPGGGAQFNSIPTGAGWQGPSQGGLPFGTPPPFNPNMYPNDPSQFSGVPYNPYNG